MMNSKNNSFKFHGQASEVENPVTLSPWTFLSYGWYGSRDQEVFRQLGCRGPQLDFVVTSNNGNFIELNQAVFDLECATYEVDGKWPAKGVSPVCFLNNTLHSLLAHAELILNGILISSSNNAHHLSVFFETEMTTDLNAKAS